MSDKIYTGTVISFSNKTNYGFIKWEGEEDMFFHFSDIVMEGYKTLSKGDAVTFKIGKNRHDQDKAIEIEKALSLK